MAHPKYVKAIRGKKTDKKDAKWIADIFKHDLVSGSYIPPADIRQLRDLVRYHTKLTNFTTGEKNHAQNCLTVSNLKLDSVFSDVFGKASSNIIGHILANPSEKLSDVSAFRTKHMKATDEEILEAIDGEFELNRHTPNGTYGGVRGERESPLLDFEAAETAGVGPNVTHSDRIWHILSVRRWSYAKGETNRSEPLHRVNKWLLYGGDWLHDGGHEGPDGAG